MSNKSHNRDNSEASLNRTEILRAVMADVESTGIRDKNKMEKLTTRVIECLVRERTLPGMEHLVPKYQQERHPFAKSEIRTAVKEILAAE